MLLLDLARAAHTVAATGAVRPLRPDRPLRAALAVHRHGTTLAGVVAAGAALHGGRPAILDEEGVVSFAALHREAEDLAALLYADGLLGPRTRLGVLCRNHRGFLHAAVAGARLGADLVPLNTDFAGPQLAAVLAREGVDLVIHDAEFAPIVPDDRARLDAATLPSLIALGARAPRPPHPAEAGRTVLLTSGTTGTPKGAPRSTTTPGPLELAAMLPGAVRTVARLRPVPRAGTPVVVAPPLFHMLGLGAAVAGLAAGSPLVLRRRFDPAGTLRAIADARAGVLVAVPTMLARIMDAELPSPAPDTSSLRMVVCGAAPLSPQLASAFMDRFGDVVFNGYGSSEVGGVSLATPADLRAAPGTIGRAAPGVRVRIVDDEGRDVPVGTTGRIFVGSPQLFAGYTGGGSKDMLDGMMAVGDVGHADAEGRLFIDGRDDDMIVSGGENVFPQEVEELLAAHPGVADAGVIGVPDERFGQRLVAYVVLHDAGAAGAPDEDALRAYVGEHLARYKVPREVHVVDVLPRTATGKLRRVALREAGAP